MIPLHQELLTQILAAAGQPTQHTYDDAYLGNHHKRYPISIPVLRSIASKWMKEHKTLSPQDFKAVITSLVMAPSATEKFMTGLLADYATDVQRSFSPDEVDHWLDYLEGWAEIDTFCTSKFTSVVLADRWPAWKKLLTALAKSDNINKRRAALVLLCDPIRKEGSDQYVDTAFKVIDMLKGEKDILITKAISWLLRTMIKHHKPRVAAYLNEHKHSLPAVAVRETTIKLATGRKSKV